MKCLKGFGVFDQPIGNSPSQKKIQKNKQNASRNGKGG